MSSEVHRIIVGLDASKGSVAALAISAELASTLGAELVGVFVEEAHLLGLAASGRAVEVDFFSGEARPLAADTLAEQLRLYARRARAVLRRRAEEAGVEWRFEILRDRPASGILEVAESSDLVVLGERSRSPGRRPGSTVRSVVARGGRRIVVVRARRAPRWTRLHVIYDDSPAAREGLSLALALQRAGLGRIVILKPEEVDAPEERLLEAGAEAEVRSLQRWDRSHLLRALGELGPGLVIAPRPMIVEDPEALGTLLRARGVPVAVVG